MLTAAALQVAAGMLWDSQRDRLLIALKGDHPQAGHALLYTTVQQPVLSAVCIGAVFLPQPAAAPPPRSGAAAEGGRRVLALHAGTPDGSLVASRAADDRVSVMPLAVRGGMPGFGGPVPGRSNSSGTFFG